VTKKANGSSAFLSSRLKFIDSPDVKRGKFRIVGPQVHGDPYGNLLDAENLHRVLEATDRTLHRYKTEGAFVGQFADPAHVAPPSEAESIRFGSVPLEFGGIPMTETDHARPGEERPILGFLRVPRSIYADDPSTVEV
jgi:hypothetical protein